ISVEKEGYVSIEAINFQPANASAEVSWTEIPNLGKTVSTITTLPVTAPLDEQVYVEYKVDIQSIGKAKLIVLTSPTLNYNGNKDLPYRVSINGGEEQILYINGRYKGE